MKVTKSLGPAIIVGLFSFTLLVFGIPIIGLAQSPHPCLANGTTHMGTSLGSVTSYTFYIDKDCPTDSQATAWRIVIYDIPNKRTLLDTGTTFIAIPPNPYITNALPVPRGSGYQVYVSIDWQRATGSPMNHTHYFYNP